MSLEANASQPVTTTVTEKTPEVEALQPTRSLDQEAREKHARVKVVARQIADDLGEQEAGPKQTIRRSVSILGEEVALALWQETQKIEAAGGTMLPDGSRRRTRGGVYFQLVRNAATGDERRRIFQVVTKGKKTSKAPSLPETQPKPQTTSIVAWTWTERGPVLDETEEKRGETRTVKTTLIGRPEKIVERGQCVALSMQQSEKIPSLPAGLPLPPAAMVAETRYSVYIAAKQWRKVADAINKNHDDVLIIEGFQMLDKERGTIAVFASNVTTKVLQSAARAAKS